jgi:hypothetical protein
MIKTTAPYHLPGYKTLALVVESEPISRSDNYYPTSIPGSSNPVMAKERTHSRAREQRPSRIQDHSTMCSGSPNNFWYVLSSRTHGTNVLSGSISVDKL